MKCLWKHKRVFQSIMLLLFAFAGPGPKHAWGDEFYCNTGAAMPPFLAAGVDANLLMIIDNSASMLDLAYVDEVDQDYCYDDTYTPGSTYAGYFPPHTWYAYDFGDGQFEARTAAEATTFCNTAAFSASDICIDGNVTAGELTTVTGFFAKGNVLNWAAASKLDIQKKILTGGKYQPVEPYSDTNGNGSWDAGEPYVDTNGNSAWDDAGFHFVLESRGCLERRYAKKIEVTGAGVTNYLTLGVRPPGIEDIEPFPPWEDATAYAIGDVVKDFGDLYIATTAGTSSGTGVDDDSGVTWVAYNLTRWTDGTTYPPGSIVSDPGKANTVDEGKLYITAAGGAANGTGIDDDTGITDWVPYDLTHIEIFKVNPTGFDHDACQDAVEELALPNPNQGQLKQYIDDCMGYVQGGGSSDEANSHAAFNHAIHNCWYRAKHGIWPPGQGPVQSMANACEDIYNSGINPWDITTADRGYGCFGVWDADPADQLGYVGRCWKPGAGSFQCTKTHPQSGECQKWEWVGGDAPGWDASGYSSVDECIETAMQDYCGVMEIPEVIDPSDQAGETGEFWNIPAVLVDSGVVAQLDEPIAVLTGLVELAQEPTGLIHEFADDIRMGAMSFNREGSDSECGQPDPYVLYSCGDASNRDGGSIISYIDQSVAHTNDLASAINDIKATTWTPIAEAFYNAIGYYTQNSQRRLDNNDFQIGAGYDPIEYWCQDNNILIITEGASTADWAPDLQAFALDLRTHADYLTTGGPHDADSDDVANCGDLSGSTLLDDLTHYARLSTNLHPTQIMGGDGIPKDKNNITTHIVAAGTLRSTGADECSPDVFLEEAAANGGTTLYVASNPTQLENALRDVFFAIRAGASAGSAASVISASRGGEGAIYQAIFWPKIELIGGGSVDWIGEVHALFVDTLGELYEDTNGNRAMDAGDEKVFVYFDEAAGVTKACNGDLNPDGTCNGTSKDLDEIRYLWSAAEWLANVAPNASDASQDIIVNRTPVATPVPAEYISNTKKRFIFTWNDLDNDGLVEGSEIFDFVPTIDWAAQAVDAASRGPVPLDFGVETSAEVNEIIKWVRGLDQAGQRSRQMPYDFDLDGMDEIVTWRIGDVIHSTPMAVAGPSENLHALYRDQSYAQFASAYKKRRHVIYYGGNDGMLHAVNGGFYDETNKRFCRTLDCSDEGATPTSSPEVGAELWAYVPYNLLPHVKCLAEEVYDHKYFVDQRVRVFDARIFPADAIHTQGWGTILVGSMRFGGAKIQPGGLDLDDDGSADYPNDNREFTSAYFIFDITNPEMPPVLLAELTRQINVTPALADLGFTTPIPTVVTFKDGPNVADTAWYLMLGSGPTDLDGTSTQQARLAVLPLNWLVATPTAFRIPDLPPAAAPNDGGVFTIAVADSLISDLITVDFDTEPNYMADVVYFGLVSGDWGNWGGGLYRLVTRELDVNGIQVATVPNDWSSLINPLNNPLPLIDVGQPVTAAASAGWDGKNFWIYFGTGRFLHRNDITDVSSNAQQSYYGIKEPWSFTQVGLACLGEFTWETVEITPLNHDSTPGWQGLLQVDQILINEATSSADSLLSCIDGTTNCLPVVDGSPITNFDELLEYIVGTGSGCDVNDSMGTDGWYRDFCRQRERNVGQAALLGGLLTFTTYQPFAD
ncbi:MAG: PilC/PilY family type IV pilus protein, partial [Thermodesulfobacteriota bacterium]|nr:PilC/PilY family type IV pilus protein [Thermodesulfobacteriota bacterium]